GRRVAKRVAKWVAGLSSSMRGGSDGRRGRWSGWKDATGSGSRSSLQPGPRLTSPSWPKRSGAVADDPDRATDEAAGGGRAGRLPPGHRWPGPHVPRSARRGSILGGRVRVPESTSDGDQVVDV